MKSTIIVGQFVADQEVDGAKAATNVKGMA